MESVTEKDKRLAGIAEQIVKLCYDNQLTIKEFKSCLKTAKRMMENGCLSVDGIEKVKLGGWFI